MATAQQLIIQSGLSNKQLSQIYGRDPRYFGLIRQGKRSGESYVSSLETLVRGENVPPVARKPQHRKTSGTIRDEQGRIIAASSKSVDGVQIQRNIRSIGKSHGNIGVSVTIKKFKGYNMEKPEKRVVHLWSHGVSAHYIDTMIDIHGSLSNAIKAELEELSHVETAQGISDITVNAIY